MAKSDDGCYEVIIIGAGVQGSAAAYYLTQSMCTRKVLLLEQFPVPTTRGSSNGSSRITRRAYSYPFYVKMMEEAFHMWSTLEKESQSTLYLKTGILVFGPPDDHRVQGVKKSLDSNNIAYTTLSGTEVNRKYNKQLSLPDDFTCVLEEDGGILCASKAVQAYQKLFISAGGELKDEHPVTEIVPGQVITVRTTKGSFASKRLIITAGPWSGKLLQTIGLELPLKVLSTEALYWKTDYPEDFSSDNFHTFISFGGTEMESDMEFYGIPIKEYPGLVKICHHSGPETDPDTRDSLESFNSPKIVSEFISKFFKGVATQPSIIEPCMYTVTPDGHPVLDKHPEHSNIVIGAGFSGHGFKLSPVVGKILSELCLGLKPSYDLSPFKIGRFS